MQYVSNFSGRQYVPGIYIIKSKCGKVYVGSAVSLRTRFMCHRQKLRDNDHDNSRLQNFYNKHGVDSLVFEVLEFCDRSKLIEREQYYIDTLNPYFNIARTAGATYGLKPWLNRRHSDETKSKIRNTNLATFAARPKKEKPKRLSREENIDRIRNMAKTEEARERNRQRMLGHKYWLGRKHKPETIQARTGAGNGRARKVYCLELNKTFAYCKEAADFFGMSKPGIANAIKRGTKVKHQYSLSYVD